MLFLSQHCWQKRNETRATALKNKHPKKGAALLTRTHVFKGLFNLKSCKGAKPPWLLFKLLSETWRHREKCRFRLLYLLAGPDDGNEDPGDEEDDEGAAKHAFKNSFFKIKSIFGKYCSVIRKAVSPPQAVKSHLVWKAKTVRARVTPALFYKK